MYCNLLILLLSFTSIYPMDSDSESTESDHESSSSSTSEEEMAATEIYIKERIMAPYSWSESREEFVHLPEELVKLSAYTSDHSYVGQATYRVTRPQTITNLYIDPVCQKEELVQAFVREIIAKAQQARVSDLDIFLQKNLWSFIKPLGFSKLSKQENNIINVRLVLNENKRSEIAKRHSTKK